MSQDKVSEKPSEASNVPEARASSSKNEEKFEDAVENQKSESEKTKPGPSKATAVEITEGKDSETAGHAPDCMLKTFPRFAPHMPDLSMYSCTCKKQLENTPYKGPEHSDMPPLIRLNEDVLKQPEDSPFKAPGPSDTPPSIRVNENLLEQLVNIPVRPPPGLSDMPLSSTLENLMNEPFITPGSSEIAHLNAANQNLDRTPSVDSLAKELELSHLAPLEKFGRRKPEDPSPKLPELSETTQLTGADPKSGKSPKQSKDTTKKPDDSPKKSETASPIGTDKKADKKADKQSENKKPQPGPSKESEVLLRQTVIPELSFIPNKHCKECGSVLVAEIDSIAKRRCNNCISQGMERATSRGTAVSSCSIQ